MGNQSSTKQGRVCVLDMENGKDIFDPVVNKKLKRTNRAAYFFLNGDLHRLIRKSAAQNICYAMNLKTNEVNKYTYKDYKAFKKKAYTISEVGYILRRHIDRIRVALASGAIKKPFMVQHSGRTGVYYFSEEDIYEIREYFANIHRGRPRSDGIVISKDVPTIAEVDAMLDKKPMLYVRTKEGNFVPVWRQEEFD